MLLFINSSNLAPPPPPNLAWSPATDSVKSGKPIIYNMTTPLYPALGQRTTTVIMTTYIQGIKKNHLGVKSVPGPMSPRPHPDHVLTCRRGTVIRAGGGGGGGGWGGWEGALCRKWRMSSYRTWFVHVGDLVAMVPESGCALWNRPEATLKNNSVSCRAPGEFILRTYPAAFFFFFFFFFNS